MIDMYYERHSKNAWGDSTERRWGFSQVFRVEKAFELGFENVDLGMIGSPNKIQDA